MTIEELNDYASRKLGEISADQHPESRELRETMIMWRVFNEWAMISTAKQKYLHKEIDGVGEYFHASTSLLEKMELVLFEVLYWEWITRREYAPNFTHVMFMNLSPQQQAWAWERNSSEEQRMHGRHWLRIFLEKERREKEEREQLMSEKLKVRLQLAA